MRPAHRAARVTVRVDAEEEVGACVVRDPRPSDVAHARSRRLRPRHDDRHARAAEQRAQPERDVEHEVRLARAGDDAVRAAPVLDLPRRRPRPDRLGLEVRPLVVARVDDDGGACGSCGSCDREREDEDEDDGAGPARHAGGPTRIRIQTNVRITPGTKSTAAATMRTFAAVESRSTARPANMQSPARTQSAAPKAPIRTRSRLDELSRRGPRRAR